MMTLLVLILYCRDELDYLLIHYDKVTGKVASQTTMGFVIDDLTGPQDVGEAAKKFFNDGSNINCQTDWSPKCCPPFSIKNHVLDWLSKPERESSIPSLKPNTLTGCLPSLFTKFSSPFFSTLGLRKTEQRFLSPQSNAKRLKSCVMVKRSLFDQSTLQQLDKATGDSQEETEVMETAVHQEKCLPSEATTDLEGLRKENNSWSKP
ncbi:hypothetical protein P5673_025003 [Acropora cervicornis]|uniref:Uncharacterized protein n=1 Tax=Acropora cervicornis TaxID=6130 RepID=A0AAD9UXF9_ACRCE|nr:hypothetical protein P5673_025003 [Acropora cervicornis]